MGFAFPPYPECGLAICGVSRIGDAPTWISEGVLPPIPTECGVARCGQSYIGGTPRKCYAGLIPICADDPIIALTENIGGPADPRQHYDEAYDNPSYTLHIISDDLLLADSIADIVRKALDFTAHHSTPYGDINTLSVGPTNRTVRTSGPRYDLTMVIDAEVIRSIDYTTIPTTES